jgi:hypothetical protein
VESFQSYVDLFNLMLGLKQDAPEIELPSLWLFDIVGLFCVCVPPHHFIRSLVSLCHCLVLATDEFIYQFQSFHAFRARKDLSEADIKVLLEEDQHVLWHHTSICLSTYLSHLIRWLCVFACVLCHRPGVLRRCCTTSISW